MNHFVAFLKLYIRLAIRQGGGAGLAISFFLIVVAIFPLGLGPDLNLLTRVAPGMLWTALLLSALLTLDRVLQSDYEDGSLDILATGALSLEMTTAAKALAHWLTTGIPLALCAPLLGILLNLDSAAILPLVVTMLAGTPAISFVGLIGAALTLALRRGGLLTAILILPLYVPTLIFGVSAIQSALSGPVPFSTPFLSLCAMSLVSLVLAPLAAAAAIRASLR